MIHTAINKALDVLALLPMAAPCIIQMLSAFKYYLGGIFI